MFSHNYVYFGTMVLCHVPPVCSSSPKIFKGYLKLKIIDSVIKYLIKHPAVKFLLSGSTKKNCSDIYVIMLRLHYVTGGHGSHDFGHR